MPTDPADLITLTEAIRLYGHSRPYWTGLIQVGPPKGVMSYQIPGDRNVYLSKTELEAFFKPKPYRPQADEGSA